MRWGLLAIVAVTLLGCGGTTSSSANAAVRVAYEITDTDHGVVSVTYQSEGGGTEQDTNAKTPWKDAELMHPGDYIYVSAQRDTGSESGSVTCTITIAGKQIKTSTSHGQFSIATCSGTVPH